MIAIRYKFVYKIGMYANVQKRGSHNYVNIKRSDADNNKFRLAKSNRTTEESNTFLDGKTTSSEKMKCNLPLSQAVFSHPSFSLLLSVLLFHLFFVIYFPHFYHLQLSRFRIARSRQVCRLPLFSLALCFCSFTFSQPLQLSRCCITSSRRSRRCNQALIQVNDSE